MTDDRRDLPGFWAQGEAMHFPEARSPGHAVRLYREAFARSEVAVNSGKTVDGLEVATLRRRVAEVEGKLAGARRACDGWLGAAELEHGRVVALRSLLGAVAAVDPVIRYSEVERACLFCETDMGAGDHASDCPWVLAGAALAGDEGEGS